MVKLVVLYGHREDHAAFDAHFADVHVPLTEKVPGLKRFEHGHTLGAPDGSQALYYYLAELTFDDGAALQAAMASPEGEAAGADVANFASGGVTLMVAES